MALEKFDLEMLLVDIQTKDQLYACYMPFIKNGGLFINTEKNFPLAKELVILLKLLDEKDKFSLKVKVVWITPKFSQGRRHAGIGVQFLSDNAQEVRSKIENYLAGYIANDKITETL